MLTLGGLVPVAWIVAMSARRKRNYVTRIGCYSRFCEVFKAKTCE